MVLNMPENPELLFVWPLSEAVSLTGRNIMIKGRSAAAEAYFIIDPNDEIPCEKACKPGGTAA